MHLFTTLPNLYAWRILTAAYYTTMQNDPIQAFTAGWRICRMVHVFCCACLPAAPGLAAATHICVALGSASSVLMSHDGVDPCILCVVIVWIALTGVLQCTALNSWIHLTTRWLFSQHAHPIFRWVWHMSTCELRLPMQVHAQYHLAAFRPYKGCSIFFFWGNGCSNLASRQCSFCIYYKNGQMAPLKDKEKGR